MKEPGDPIDPLDDGKGFDESLISDHDPDVVAGMQRLQILREAEREGILEFPSRTQLRPV